MPIWACWLISWRQSAHNPNDHAPNDHAPNNHAPNNHGPSDDAPKNHEQCHHEQNTTPHIHYISSHETPLFPGTGEDEQRGQNGVWDFPYPPFISSADFRNIYDSHIVPLLEDLNPDILLISAGFDAHKDDPLSTAQLVEDDFEYITHRLVSLGKPILCALEGGYNLDALENSIIAHLNALQ